MGTQTKVGYIDIPRPLSVALAVLCFQHVGQRHRSRAWTKTPSGRQLSSSLSPAPPLTKPGIVFSTFGKLILRGACGLRKDANTRVILKREVQKEGKRAVSKKKRAGLEKEKRRLLFRSLSRFFFFFLRCVFCRGTAKVYMSGRPGFSHTATFCSVPARPPTLR